MEKSIVTKFCIINTVCLVLFQMIHIIIELLKKNVSNSVELTQSQIMEQMKYSKVQSVFSYLTYACILLIIIILCVSVVQKKYEVNNHKNIIDKIFDNVRRKHLLYHRNQICFIDHSS